jgi:hypothetical protein
MRAPIVDLTLSDDSDEKEAVHDTTTTTTSLTTANTMPVSSTLKILSNRKGVSYAFDGYLGSKEATTAEGRAMLWKEFRVHEKLKTLYRGVKELKDLPVVLAMGWSDTGFLQRGTLGGFVMRHVDSG